MWILVFILCSDVSCSSFDLKLFTFGTDTECRHHARLTQTDPLTRRSYCTTEGELFEE